MVSGCQKSHLPLPAMTREGRNTIGYIYHQEYSVIGLDEETDFIKYSNNVITIFDSSRVVKYAFYSMSDEISLRLNLTKDPETQIFDLSNAIFYRESSRLILNPHTTNVFEVNYFNEDSRIVAGIFDLHFARPDTNWFHKKDSLGNFMVDSYGSPVFGYEVKWSNKEHITDGRFDIKY